jgi:tetratricopeptide (TPR) repeat protein
MLKRLILLMLLCFNLLQGNAQQKSTDSLWQLAITTKNDSIKFNLLNKIGNLTFSSIEEMLENAKREVAYGEKYKDKPSEAYGYFLFARLYNRIGNYTKSQESIAKASIIAETMPYNNNYLAIIYNTKGTSETNNNKAIEYLEKGIAICKDDLIKRI